jgi:hypothetical protein
MVRGRRAIALTLILAGIVVLGVLGWLAYTGSRELQVRGIVTSVEARDIGHTAAIMLRTSDGREQRFLVDPSADAKWTPGHLRDHMTFANPVTIYYRRAGDALVAYRITD